MMQNERKLYQRQDEVLRAIRESGVIQSPYLLAGGTALARAYLHHRISYDLDFFVDGKFSPEMLRNDLRRNGIVLDEVAMQPDTTMARELHGIIVSDPPVKISFIEDPFATMFDVVEINGFVTETIHGLYHRKVRTVSGSYNLAGAPVGARQTARDLFDLYVLDREVQPVLDFISEINGDGAGVPEDGFFAGMRSMPWSDLTDEFAMLTVSAKHQGISLRDIRKHFDASLGMKANKP